MAKQLCDEQNLSLSEIKEGKLRREKEEARNISSFKLLKSELIGIMKDKKISWSRKRHCFDLLSRCLVRIDFDLTQTEFQKFNRSKHFLKNKSQLYSVFTNFSYVFEMIFR